VSDEPFEHDVQKRIPDVTKAREVLGFEATTTLDEMLDEVIPWILKGLLSRTAGLSLHWLARVGTRDATNSFKGYSVDFVRDVGIHSDTGFEVGLELVAKARRLRLPVAEIPTIWLDRAAGQSNFKMWQWIPHYLRWYRFAFGPAFPDTGAVRVAARRVVRSDPNAQPA
jgi:dolichol-phosphate mannosyltransferase